jgi:hypothetical protein
MQVCHDGRRAGKRQSPHAHTRNGIRLANLRALRAAQFYREHKSTTSFEEAALSHGSNVAYVQAGVVVLEHNDQKLIDRILHGHVSIEAAAKLIKPQVKAIAAFAAADEAGRVVILAELLGSSSPEELAALGRKIGVDTIWDSIIAPNT